MDFDKELKNAISRGKNRGQTDSVAEQAAKLTKEQLRNRHNEFRLALSDHIEHQLRSLAVHFPGFEYETIYGERGWGGAINRDDITRSGSMFSRLELVVRPMSEFEVVNITGKGTIQNREVTNWNHYEPIQSADQATFRETINQWVIQYAELFAAAR